VEAPGHGIGFGRELFANMRSAVTSAEEGATSFGRAQYTQPPVAASTGAA